ncbi:MAG: FxsA family protein [Hyphomicrobiaceae bacterium]|nr:FxsA family protein [Hyphomicrobiaceae bacterium]
MLPQIESGMPAGCGSWQGKGGPGMPVVRASISKATMIRLGVGVFLIVLPFLELILLVKLTGSIGFLWTLTLMVASAVGGGMLVAQQSASSFRQTLEAASRGEAPQNTVLEGGLLMLAGILFIVPGLITDAMALVLLIPPVRGWLGQRLMAGLARAAAVPDPFEDSRPRPGAPSGSGQRPGDGPVIEGEFQRLDERPAGRRPGGDRG